MSSRRWHTYNVLPLRPIAAAADIDLHNFVERHVIATTIVELRGAH
jgi:hypothetical protein